MSSAAHPPADPLTWLFDRERKVHPWSHALAELCTAGADRRWVVGTNWQMDHRVSESREADLQTAHFVGIADAEDWWEALSLYFQEEICLPCSVGAGPPISGYLRTTNLNNQVPVRVPGFDLLVHVASLNNLLGRVATGPREADVSRELQRLIGRGLPSRPRGGPGTGWMDGAVRDLAVSLLRSGEDGIRETAGLLVDALGETEPPWWACFAHEVQPLLKSGEAAGLCSALGLGHRRAGEWLLVWRYPVGEAFPIYRPTVVEANDSPYHHPSPPHYLLGITMPLDHSRGACREVIHRPLRGEVARRRCTGQLLELVGFNPARTSGDIAALRRTQQARLRKEFPEPETSDWFDRHPSPL